MEIHAGEHRECRAGRDLSEVRFDPDLEGSGLQKGRGILSHREASARKRLEGQADLSVQGTVGKPRVRPSGAEI